jgi:putative DNA primase/helicase
MAGVAYHCEAECPQWLAFLTRCFPEPEIRAYLQRWFGYCLTGDNREKILLLIHGAGDNGKTILLEIIKMVMGNYAEHVQFSSLSALKWKDEGANVPKGDLVSLMKARFVKADESTRNMSLNEAMIKQLTGGGEWKGRVNYGEPQTYIPFFKMVLSSNFVPKMSDDQAAQKRIHYLPMARQFSIGMPGRVEKLKELLATEREGIAAWMIEGYRQYAEQGLNPPEYILHATEQFRARSDIQAEFFAEMCQLGGEVLLRDLHGAHRQWVYNTGAGEEASLSITELEDLVQERKFKIERVQGTHGRPKAVRGLSLNGQGGPGGSPEQTEPQEDQLSLKP